MDSFENLDNSPADTIVATDMTETGDSLQVLKYLNDDEGSFEKNETSIEELTENRKMTIKEEVVENNVMTSNDTVRELNDCVQSSLNTADVSDLLVPSETITSFVKSNILKSDENSLENTFNSDSFPKPSMDDECNSDMQDEEIQLRWDDDDDDDEISFIGGTEENCINSAHLIKNEPGIPKAEDEALIVQGIKMEKSPDISFGTSDLEFLSYNVISQDIKKERSPTPDIVFEESLIIKTEPENNQSFEGKIKTCKEEEKPSCLEFLDFQESSENDFDRKQIEEFLIIKQEPTTSISEKKLTHLSLETTQFEFSEDVSFDTVVEKHFHCLQEGISTSVGDEKKILFEGIGLVESTPGNYDTVQEKVTDCEDVESEYPLGTRKEEVKNVNFLIEDENFIEDITTTKIINDTCVIKNKEVSVNDMQKEQLSKIDLHTDNEFPVKTKIVIISPDKNLSSDNKNPFSDNNIPCTKETPEKIKSKEEVVSVDRMEKQESIEIKLESNTMILIDGKDEREPVEKEIKLELFSKQLIKEAGNDENSEEKLEHVSTSNENYVEDKHIAMHDAIVGASIGIITQHGLKKPDMMLEIPTKELMNFMDDDDNDNDLDLLGNLEMSPDDAGTEIRDHDDIKETNVNETKPIEVSDLEKRIENTVKPFGEIFQNQQSSSDDKIHQITVVEEPKPSTSKACMEIRTESDKADDFSDNLDLLAESTRVLEYDDDYKDEGEDFYQDEGNSSISHYIL